MGLFFRVNFEYIPVGILCQTVFLHFDSVVWWSFLCPCIFHDGKISTWQYSATLEIYLHVCANDV